MAFAEYELDNVQFIKGEPTPYKSSSNVTRTFCKNCGSSIEWKRDDIPNRTSLTLGLFDSADDFGAMDDLYEEESPSWNK